MSKIDEIRAEMVKAMKEKDKERKDSLSMLLSALKNKAIDKREKEQCEKRLAVYQAFVPADLSEDAVREIIQGVLNDLGIEKATPKDKGRIMKELMPKVKGKAEGAVVNKLVGEFMA